MDMWDLAKKINSCQRNDFPLRLIFKVCRVLSVVKELDVVWRSSGSSTHMVAHNHV